MTNKFVSLYKDKTGRMIYYDFEKRIFFKDKKPENAKLLPFWLLVSLALFGFPALASRFPIDTDSNIVAYTFLIGFPLVTILAFVTYILWMRHSKRLHTTTPRVECVSLSSDESSVLLENMQKSIRQKRFVFVLVFGVFIGAMIISIISPDIVFLIAAVFMWGGTVYIILEDKPYRTIQFYTRLKRGDITV